MTRVCRCGCGESFDPVSRNQQYAYRKCRTRASLVRQRQTRVERKGRHLPAGRPCPVCGVALAAGKTACSRVCNGRHIAKQTRVAHWRRKLTGVTSVVQAFTMGREAGFGAGYQAGYRKGFDDGAQARRPKVWLPSARTA